MNSMENSRFDKEDYFHVLVLYTGYFIKEIENICSRVPIRYRNTRGPLRGGQSFVHEVWEGSCSHFNFSFSQTSTRVSVTVWKHENFFYFLNNDFLILYLK